MVIIHLLTGMILQVLPIQNPFQKMGPGMGPADMGGPGVPRAWRIIPVTVVSGDRITPMYFSHEKAMNGRGPTTRSLGDLRSRCLLTYSAKGP